MVGCDDQLVEYSSSVHMDWRNDDIVQRLGLDMVTYILMLTSVSLNFAFGELAGKRKETIDLFTLLSK